MATAKIEIKVGSLHFLGEGEQDWVSKQLDKLLAQASLLGRLGEQPESGSPKPRAPGAAGAAQVGTLSGFLSSKNATTNQVAKFLATAGWLHLRGRQQLTTSDVAKALKDAQQARLGNAAECLNQNVRKGFCEKDGGGFFITAEGLVQLGISK